MLLGQCTVRLTCHRLAWVPVAQGIRQYTLVALANNILILIVYCLGPSCLSLTTGPRERRASPRWTELKNPSHKFYFLFFKLICLFCAAGLPGYPEQLLCWRHQVARCGLLPQEAHRLRAQELNIPHQPHSLYHTWISLYIDLPHLQPNGTPSTLTEITALN